MAIEKAGRVTLTWQQLREELTELTDGYCKFKALPRDRDNFCSALAWLVEFQKWWMTDPSGKASLPYIAEEQDCEDITREHVAAANRARVLSKTAPPGCGHTVFECQVELANGGRPLNDVGNPGPEAYAGHETTLVRVASGIWVFAEGQNGNLQPAREWLNENNGSNGSLVFAGC